MVGFGETYIPAFALAVGLGPVAAGLTAAVPVLCGALLQLVTPRGVDRLGTNRGWVVACTTLQALSFVPLVWWAIRGHATLGELLAAASVYWGAGMAGAPAWNAWIGTLIPESARTSFFAQRGRLSQFAICLGFVAGGLILQWGERRGRVLLAFAAIFALAAVSRLVSTALLAACSEPVPPRPRGTRPAGEESPSLGLVAAARGMVASPAGAVVALLWAFVFGAQFAGPYFTPYMLREQGFSYHAFMLVMASSFLAKAVMAPLFGRIASRIGAVSLIGWATVAITPLSLLWLPSANLGYLVVVQLIAGACWAAYELAVALLFFEAVSDRERTAVVTIYNLGLAVATVAGAGCGGWLLRACGSGPWAYEAVFIGSSVLRLAALPLLLWLRR